MNEETKEVSTTAAPATTAAGGKAKPKKAAPKAAKKQAKAKAKAPAKKAAPKAAKKGGKTPTGPGVLRQYAPNYHKDNEKKTAGGNVSVDSNDTVAQKLRGKTLDDVYAFAAKALSEPEKDLRKKYEHLNVGMQRMNLGNRIRAAANAK